MTKTLHQRIKLSFLVCVIAIAFPLNSAKAQKILPMFGDVTIDKNFSPDPMLMRGVSGGSTPGRVIAGRRDTPTGACTGFFDEKPDHTLRLNRKFDYLKLKVTSSGDTALIVKGPDGIWCNDDLKGKNPEIVGEWLPGQYQLWLGSFSQDKHLPYTITITDIK